MTTPDPGALENPTVPSVFRAVVEQHADRPALEADGVSMTYAELDRLSNRIANGLLARGGTEPIAMVAPLEPASIAVMIGALKAGRIFAPLDPRYPAEQVALVREELGACLLATDAIEELAAGSDTDPALQLESDHPSLVYFTSGSSGRPKGTIKSHAHMTWPPLAFGITAEDRFASIVPLGFAMSMTPVFGGLLAGATVCLFDPITRGIDLLAEWIGETSASVLKVSPSVLRAVAAALDERGRPASAMRLAIMAGEPCQGDQLNVVRRMLPRATIMNVYGSTEGGYIAGTTIEPDDVLEGGAIPFRWVFPHQEVAIIRDSGDAADEGEEGEIVVCGNDVSLGYWVEPDQREGNFSLEADGRRSFRTGDRGRFSADGTLDHLGRADRRVKIHGQTVDPQAVEHALMALPEIEEAVVSAVPSRDDGTRLVAHVRAATGSQPRARDVRLALARSLPAFMIPSAFFGVDSMPRTERGKVDRSALHQAALGAAPVEAAYVPPRNQREQAVADLASEVLGLERVGVHDDVFELGADSFSAVELLVAIGERLGVELTPGELLEAPTVETLALRLASQQSSAGQSIFPLHRGGSGTPFFFVSAFDGAMLPLRRLARRLDRPSYSFVPRGVDRRALPDRTIERGASRFLGALRTVQPSGPYLIGGYSFGGLVAYEIARQLVSAGEAVALVALLDPAPAKPSGPEAIRTIADDGGAPPGQPLVERGLAGRLRQRGAAASAGIVRWTPRRQSFAFYCLGLEMRHKYQPGPYDGAALFLLTRWWREHDLGMPDLVRGEKRVVDIPGDHVTMLREPHVATVAATLRDALTAADESSFFAEQAIT